MSTAGHDRRTRKFHVPVIGVQPDTHTLCVSMGLPHQIDPGAGLPSLDRLGGGEPAKQPYNALKALMIAVLEDGIRSYLSPIRRVRLEAESWISDSRHRSPFSFVVVCEALGLDSTAARRAVERLRARSGSERVILPRNRPNVRRTPRLKQQRRAVRDR